MDTTNSTFHEAHRREMCEADQQEEHIDPQILLGESMSEQFYEFIPDSTSYDLYTNALGEVEDEVKASGSFNFSRSELMWIMPMAPMNYGTSLK